MVTVGRDEPQWGGGFASLFRRAWQSIRSYWRGPLTAAELDGYTGGGRSTAAGVTVSEDRALNISAVWNAVTIIAGTLGSLPLILYKRLPDGGKERYVDHRLYKLLHDEPNPEMSAMVFRETIQQHVLLWGNGYAEIQRDQGGRIVALWPITPDRVTPRRDRDGGLFYDVANRNGSLPSTPMRPADILHIPGLGFDGVLGYSVIAHARESFGFSIGVERFGGAFFGNAATPGAVLEHPRGLQEPTRQAIKAQLDEYRRGGSHGTILLEEGVVWKPTTIPPEDAQFLETRRFQVTEIARWFNVPPHKIKDLERATFTNIEHQGLEFVTDTLRPWLVRWEQEINRKLIAPLERRSQYVEHLVDALLRGDTESRYRAYAVGRQWGWLSANDIRRPENMNPLPANEGDVYLVPLNMIPADAEPAPPEPPPAPPVPEPTPSRDLTPSLEPLTRDDVKGMVEALLADARAEVPSPSEPPPVPESAPSPDGTDLPHLIAGHRAVVADVAGRMVRQETYKARRAAKSAERLRGWAEAFYPAHAEKFAAALMPALEAHLATLPGGGDAQERAGEIVAAHVSHSQADIRQLLARGLDGEALHSAADAIFCRWETERPGQIADAVLRAAIEAIA